MDCVIQTHDGRCISAIWTGNGETIVTVGYDGQMRVWNLESAADMSRIAPLLVVPVHGVRDMKRIGRRLVTLSVPVNTYNGLTLPPAERRFSVEIWDIEQIDTMVENSRIRQSSLMLNAPLV